MPLFLHYIKIYLPRVERDMTSQFPDTVSLPRAMPQNNIAYSSRNFHYAESHKTQSSYETVQTQWCVITAQQFNKMILNLHEIFTTLQVLHTTQFHTYPCHNAEFTPATKLHEIMQGLR